MEMLPEDNPGPNAYFPKQISRPYSQITLKSRYTPSSNHNITPAPNAYNPYNKFTSKVPPAFTLKGRPAIDKVDNSNPGPGYYDLARSSIYRKDGVSIISRHESVIHNVSPGPNQYYTERSLFDKNKGISITSRHDTYKADKTPGVGTYNIYETFKPPKPIVYYQKYDNREYSATPGPGSYYVNFSIFGKKRVKGAAFQGRYSNKVNTLVY